MRTGLAELRRARLPWWSYLGGLGGAAIVVIGTYVVPVLGVAVFTIAQVAGSSVGGLGVDRAGLAPAGRLPLTLPRVAGALLGMAAVALAQLGQPVGELAVGLVLLAVAGGLAVAAQTALNGRVADGGSAAAGLAINFATSTPAVLVVAALVGAFAGSGRPGRTPGTSTPAGCSASASCRPCWSESARSGCCGPVSRWSPVSWAGPCCWTC